MHKWKQNQYNQCHSEYRLISVQFLFYEHLHLSFTVFSGCLYKQKQSACFLLYLLLTDLNIFCCWFLAVNSQTIASVQIMSERARDQHEPIQSQREPSHPWLLEHIIASVPVVTSLIGWFSEWSKGQIFHIKSLLRKQITPFSTFNVKGLDSLVWVVILIQFKIESMWMCACNL